MSSQVKTFLITSIAIICGLILVADILFINSLSGFRVAEKIPLTRVEAAVGQDKVAIRYQAQEHLASTADFEMAKESEPFLYRTWHSRRLALNVERNLNWGMWIGFAAFLFTIAPVYALRKLLFARLPKKPASEIAESKENKPLWPLFGILSLVILLPLFGLYWIKMSEKDLVEKIPLSRASLTFITDTDVRVVFGSTTTEMRIKDLQESQERDPFLYRYSSGSVKVGMGERSRQLLVSIYVCLAAAIPLAVLMIINYIKKKVGLASGLT